MSADQPENTTALSDEDAAEHAVWQFSPHRFPGYGPLCLLCGADRTRAIHNQKWALTGGRGFIVGVPIGPVSPPVDGPARTVEVSDRTGRTDPDVP